MRFGPALSFTGAMVLLVVLINGSPCRRTRERTVSVDDRTTEIVARTIYAEARSEQNVGRWAVATVIYNRAEGDPDKFVEVCLKPKQFSCWNENPDGDLSILSIPIDPVWTECWEFAEKMEKDFFPMGEWDHYYAHRLCQPSWRTALVDVVVIGNHTFGRHE